MTDEEIDISIAEHMGWKDLHKIPQIASMHHGWSGINPETGHDEFIPQYCNDLDAMHEMERTVMCEPLYWVKLVEVVLGFEYVDFESHNEYSCLEVATAPARQRAEAFLKAIGKWDQK